MHACDHLSCCVGAVLYVNRSIALAGVLRANMCGHMYLYACIYMNVLSLPDNTELVHVRCADAPSLDCNIRNIENHFVSYVRVNSRRT